MYKKVFDFNKARNNFKFKFEDELVMIQEEIKEFYDSTDLADRVDAYIDFTYVVLGTTMKASKAGAVITQDFVNHLERTDKLMMGILTYELGSRTDEILLYAKNLVCDCNELKTMNLDSKGKVIKGDIPNATELIRTYLISLEAI